MFSGTPTAAGVFTFTVDATDTGGALVSRTYTVTIPDVGAPVTSTIATSASPVAGGSTTGDGVYDNGTHVTVVATHSPGYAFVNWTEGGVEVSDSAVYPFTVNADRTLVANFVPTYTVATSASPAAGGTTSGDGTFNGGTSVTVTATPNAGYAFVNWTEGDAVVSASASYTFTIGADRTLVANFVPTYTVATSASPTAGGSTNGDGTFNGGTSVTVTATPSSGYVFVNWTEGGAVVSSSASYTFTLGSDRTLVASFLPDTPILSIESATAVRNGGKVEVTVVILNSGGVTASATSIDGKKDATLDGKSMHEHAPWDLGGVAPLGTSSTTLTFTGVKAGAQTLQTDARLHGRLGNSVDRRPGSMTRSLGR